MAHLIFRKGFFKNEPNYPPPWEKIVSCSQLPYLTDYTELHSDTTEDWDRGPHAPLSLLTQLSPVLLLLS